MARKKKEVAEVTANHLDDMIKVLKISIDALQAMIADSVKTKQISIAELSRATKMIGETLNQIYRIEYGKKQKEEMLNMIGELQRHFSRAQQVSAERERRARSKPLVRQVSRVLTEEEIDTENDETEESVKYQLSLDELKHGS